MPSVTLHSNLLLYQVLFTFEDIQRLLIHFTDCTFSSLTPHLFSFISLTWLLCFLGCLIEVHQSRRCRLNTLHLFVEFLLLTFTALSKFHVAWYYAPFYSTIVSYILTLKQYTIQTEPNIPFSINSRWSISNIESSCLHKNIQAHQPKFLWTYSPVIWKK